MHRVKQKLYTLYLHQTKLMDWKLVCKIILVAGGSAIFLIKYDWLVDVNEKQIVSLVQNNDTDKQKAYKL